MKKFLVLFSICCLGTLAQAQCAPEQSGCDYIFKLRDAFGDGWNGNTMTVSQNSVPVAALNLIGSNMFDQTVTLCDDTPFELFWNAGGNFPSEVYISIVNPDGQVIYNKPRGYGAQNSLLYSGFNNCDNVVLTAFLDQDQDGMMDQGEPLFPYGGFTYRINNTGSYHYIDSSTGTYTYQNPNASNTYDFSFSINPEFAMYYAAPPVLYNDYSIPDGSGIHHLYFPVMQIQANANVSVEIATIKPPVPGHAFKLEIIYTNYGSLPTSGTLDFTRDPSVDSPGAVGGVTPTPTGFTYNYSLLPFETKRLDYYLNIPPIPYVNLGDLVHNSIVISAVDDTDATDNTDDHYETVVGSWDPNDKIEAHGPQIPFGTFDAAEPLDYTIRFQNTGTAFASKVRIEDLLDDQLDPESVRTISASHDYILERVDNKLSWTFDPIELPPLSANEAQSQGFVHFSVKLKPGFSAGDVIPNSAAIFFDTNPAITTNVFETTFTQTFGLDTFGAQTVLVYPNPAHDAFEVRLSNSGERIASVKLMDVLGKSVRTFENADSNSLKVDVSQLSKGVYLLEINTSDQKKWIKKLLVQ
ncbi:T9SS type A sorting domain-containing protein [Flavobacterium sp.]|uniref:T9SS type A sorting domain-containing protein n=1 Tax=Flavobacterium sp. TaxID=239 RepID=UPI0039E513EC